MSQSLKVILCWLVLWWRLSVVRTMSVSGRVHHVQMRLTLWGAVRCAFPQWVHVNVDMYRDNSHTRNQNKYKITLFTFDLYTFKSIVKTFNVQFRWKNIWQPKGWTHNCYPIVIVIDDIFGSGWAVDCCAAGRVRSSHGTNMWRNEVRIPSEVFRK